MPTDSEILDWLQKWHTLHYSVEILYVVDGYECALMNDGNAVDTYRGKDVREAIAKAMKDFA